MTPTPTIGMFFVALTAALAESVPMAIIKSFLSRANFFAEASSFLSLPLACTMSILALPPLLYPSASSAASTPAVILFCSARSSDCRMPMEYTFFAATGTTSSLTGSGDEDWYSITAITTLQTAKISINHQSCFSFEATTLTLSLKF